MVSEEIWMKNSTQINIANESPSKEIGLLLPHDLQVERPKHLIEMNHRH